MRQLVTVAAVTAVVVLAGCAVTRSGSLVRVPSGRTIPVEVTVSSDSARVTGVDPVTGERLAGTLVEDVENRRAGELSPAMPAPGTGGPIPSGEAPVRMGPATLNLRGEITGDQGTTLRCVLQVEKRLRIRGRGLCHVLGSESGISYKLSF